MYAAQFPKKNRSRCVLLPPDAEQENVKVEMVEYVPVTGTDGIERLVPVEYAEAWMYASPSDQELIIRDIFRKSLTKHERKIFDELSDALDAHEKEMVAAYAHPEHFRAFF